MVNEQLSGYIRQQFAKGLSKEDIKKAVLAAGWPSAVVEESFAAIEEPKLTLVKTPPTAPPPVTVTPQPLPVMPATTPLPTTTAPAPASATPPVSVVAPKKGRVLPFLIGVIVLVLVISGGVAYAYVAQLGPFAKSPDTSALESPTTSATTTASTATASSTTTLPSAPNGLYLGAVGSTTSSRRVVGGSTVEMERIFLRAMSEAIQLQKIDFKLTSGGTQDVTQVNLWNGSTIVGKATFAKASTSLTIAINPPILLQKYSMTDQTGELALTVKVDLAKVGTGQSGIDGDRVAIDVVNAMGVGQTSSTTIVSAKPSEEPSYSSGYGVILSSKKAIAALPHILSIIPDKNLVNAKVRVTIAGTGFTASSTVLLNSYYNSNIKPDSVSSNGTELIFTFSPDDYPNPAGIPANPKWPVNTLVLVSNVGYISFESGLGSNIENLQYNSPSTP